MSKSSLDVEKEAIPAEVIHLETYSNAPGHPVEKSKAVKKLVKKLDLLVPGILCGAYFFAYLVCSLDLVTLS